MRKAKELIGKSIVHQATGSKLAEVRDLIFETDASKIAALLVDNGGWFREARVICWESVTNIGDVVMVTGDNPVVLANEASQLSDELKEDVRITGSPIMTESGERIGTVGDLYIDDTGRVIGYEVRQGFVSDLSGRKFLLADHVRTVGKDAIIANNADLTTVKQAAREMEAPATSEIETPAVADDQRTV